MNTMVSAADVALLRSELERLREQNRCLYDAALTFGALAERLNLSLQMERLRTSTSEASVMHDPRPFELRATPHLPFKGAPS
jgi:hypothetical protein